MRLLWTRQKFLTNCKTAVTAQQITCILCLFAQHAAKTTSTAKYALQDLYQYRYGKAGELLELQGAFSTGL